MTIPLILGGLFLIGLMADLIGRFTILPRVTLLLLSGLAIGPSGLSVLPERFVEDWFAALTGIALAVGLYFLLTGADPMVALLLAGIAPATAPAAVYDLVRESGATGEFTETLLSVVAIDDVWGLLTFVFMMACCGVLGGDAAVVSGGSPRV